MLTHLHQVTVELKNDLCISGALHSVDQYLNIKLTNTRVHNEQKYPHMVRWGGGARGAAQGGCGGVGPRSLGWAGRRGVNTRRAVGSACRAEGGRCQTAVLGHWSLMKA